MPEQAVDVLKGATKKWLEILTGDGLFTELQAVLDQVTAKARYTPSAGDMFRFARFSIADPKMVILAMDPYPKLGVADGLALSTCGDTCPVTLARVFKLLETDGLIPSVPGISAACPRPYDLSYLAAQGVILLNCALTVEVDKPGSHIKIWQPWMDRVFTRLAATLPRDTPICLWGTDAQSKAPLFEGHRILKWCHPVAMQRPSFSECDHLRELAKLHPDMVWDPRKTETHFYTDGAAKGNQFTSTRASLGVACTAGLMAGRTWSKQLQTVTIPGPQPKKSKTGVGNSGVRRADGIWDVEARPTNIRAEGAALIRALELALSLPEQFASVIHTDSKLWMMDMLGAEGGKGYMIDWLERGVPWTSKSNSDLCEKIWVLWSRAMKRGNIRLHFVNAWHDRERPADGTDDLVWWLGNQAAERAAESAL
jgi:uracil-DNA glycosylase